MPNFVPNNIKEPFGQVDLELLARFLQVIGKPERLRILFCLLTGPQCVCDLTSELNRRQPYVSQQLMVLRKAGLVDSRREGWNQHYFIPSQKVKKYLRCLLNNWQGGVNLKPVPGSKQNE